jgi:hypothetical protein
MNIANNKFHNLNGIIPLNWLNIPINWYNIWGKTNSLLSQGEINHFILQFDMPLTRDVIFSLL